MERVAFVVSFAVAALIVLQVVTSLVDIAKELKRIAVSMEKLARGYEFCQSEETR